MIYNLDNPEEFYQYHHRTPEEEQQEKGACAQVEKELTEQYGKPRKNVNVGLRWLTGKTDIPDCLDHPQYRLKDGKRTLTGAPYHLYQEIKEEAHALAKKKGIQVLFREPPSNYSSATYLVILTEQGTNQTRPE